MTFVRSIAGWLVPAALVAGCVVTFGVEPKDAGPDDGSGDGGGPLDVDAAPIIDAGPPDADPPDAPPFTEGLSTLAGSGEPAFRDGLRNSARFDDPVNVAIAADGNVYVADFNNSAIRKVTPEGTVTTIVAMAGFRRPFGLAFRPDGKLYVQTDRNTANLPTGALWLLDVDTGGAQLLKNDVGRVRGMVVISDGRVIMSDYQQHAIHIYDPVEKTFSLLAGQEGVPGYGDGVGAEALFNVPYDLEVAPGDVIIVADQYNRRLRRVTMAGVVTTYIGDGIAESKDGDLMTARFERPQGLARDDAGTLYVSDPGGPYIRRVSGDQVTTVAGDGVAGFLDDPDPLKARFFGIEGIDVTPDGEFLYVADGDLGDGLPYHRIRRFQFLP